MPVSSNAFIAQLRGDAGPLRPGPRVLAPEAVDTAHRARLVAGMAEAVVEKGYTGTTIADVVARAQVSRRTFYAHFPDKEACFLAAYDAASNLLMATIAQAVERSAGRSWQERVGLGVSTYLHAMAAEPVLTRAFLVEVLAAGPEALARRRAVHARFARLLEDLVARHLEELPSGLPLRPALATALIGGVNELVLLAVEEGRAQDLPEYADVAAQLVRAVLEPPAGG